MTKSYPWYTPYQFAGNKPVWAVDLDGLEEYIKTYVFENGKATFLKITSNSELKLSGGFMGASIMKIDKRTNEPMVSSEIGTVQYQYVDSKGKPLNLRRDLNGDYVKGENEIMDLGENNMLGSIYIGPTNPTVPDPKTGKPKADYRREPLDEVDAAALVHDKDYDTKGAAGAGDAFFNRDIIFADKKLVDAATKAEEKGKSGGIDNVTGKPVTKETQSRAEKVRQFFSYILGTSDLKGKPTPSPSRGYGGIVYPVPK